MRNGFDANLKFQNEQEARCVHHAAIQEQIECINIAIGDSVDKHTKWEAFHAKLAKLPDEHSRSKATFQQRVEYIEQVLGDSADKHAKWDAAHGNISELQMEQATRGA